jgi:hypothetical protein
MAVGVRAFSFVVEVVIADQVTNRQFKRSQGKTTA